MEIELVSGLGYPEEIRELFSEYTQMLLESAPDFRAYLERQHYDRELEHLEEKYGPPGGRLYLAQTDGEPAGCIGLRKIDDASCEMKRLYVRPRFRGQSVGALLVEQILEDARSIGYSRILLDTFPFLQSAIRMYRGYGFVEVPSYNGSPMESLVYLCLDL